MYKICVFLKFILDIVTAYANNIGLSVMMDAN